MNPVRRTIELQRGRLTAACGKHTGLHPSESMLVQDGLPPPARYRAMVVIILGIALFVLDGTIVNLALPGIARDLHATAGQAVWVINAYQVATLALLLPCATLGDLVGYRRVYLSGLVLFTTRVARMHAGGFAAAAGCGARNPGAGRGRDHVGECGAGALDLPQTHARARYRDQFAGRGNSLGRRAIDRRRHPVGCVMALAVCPEPAAWPGGAVAGVSRTATKSCDATVECAAVMARRAAQRADVQPGVPGGRRAGHQLRQFRDVFQTSEAAWPCWWVAFWSVWSICADS